MISLKRYALFFSMVWFSLLRGLPLGCLSIIIPKTLNIWLRNSSDSYTFSAKNYRIIELVQSYPVRYHHWLLMGEINLILRISFKGSIRFFPNNLQFISTTFPANWSKNTILIGTLKALMGRRCFTSPIV